MAFQEELGYNGSKNPGLWKVDAASATNSWLQQNFQALSPYAHILTHGAKNTFLDHGA